MTIWAEQDLPVLRAIHELEEELGRSHVFEDTVIAERAGVGLQSCRRALDRLGAEGYIKGRGFAGQRQIAGMVTNDGLRALGEWPTASELAAALPNILRALAEKEPDSTKASVLKRGADILQGLVVGTATAVIKEVTGLA